MEQSLQCHYLLSFKRQFDEFFSLWRIDDLKPIKIEKQSHRSSVKKVFLKISQNSQETPVQTFFFTATSGDNKNMTSYVNRTFTMFSKQNKFTNVLIINNKNF